MPTVKISRKKKPRITKHIQTVDYNYGRYPKVKFCPVCFLPHTINQHRFHGKGAYERTHGS